MPQHPSTLFLGDIINSFNHIHCFCSEHKRNSPILTHLLFPGEGGCYLHCPLKYLGSQPNNWPIQGLSSINLGHIFPNIFREIAKRRHNLPTYWISNGGPKNSEVVSFSSASINPTFPVAKCWKNLLQFNMLATKQIHQNLYTECCHYYIPWKERLKES